MTTTNLRSTFDNLRTALAASLFEREHAVDMHIAAMLAGEHVLSVGRPGVAKSMLAHRIRDSIADARFFELQMARTTETSEVFGGKDLEAAKRGETRRNLDGTIAQADVAFLDEVFKSHSAILNAMLTILNERRLVNGAAGVIDVPLRFLMAASNELPELGSDLDALFDRFLVRLHVEEIKDDDNFGRLVRGELPAAPVGLFTLDDLDAARAEVGALPLDADAVRVLREIVIAARAEGMQVSDRRAVAIARFMRARAWMRGSMWATAVDAADVACCLWSSLDQIEPASALVARIVPSWEKDAREIRAAVDEQRARIAKVVATRNPDAIIEGTKEVARVLRDLDVDVDDSVRPHNAPAAKALAEAITAAREDLAAAGRLAYTL